MTRTSIKILQGSSFHLHASKHTFAQMSYSSSCKNVIYTHIFLLFPKLEQIPTKESTINRKRSVFSKVSHKKKR